MLGQSAHGRSPEDCTWVHVGTELVLELIGQQHGEQRVPPEVEEVVVDADRRAGFHLEYLAKCTGDLLFQHSARRAAGFGPARRFPGPFLECLAVELAVGGEGQPIDDHEMLREHVAGQARAEGAPENIDAILRGRDHEYHQTLVSTIAPVQHDRATRSQAQLADRVLDADQLDADAANLDLVVTPPQDLEVTLAVEPTQVARSVEATPIDVQEFLGIELRPIEVAGDHTRAREADLADGAYGERPASLVQDAHFDRWKGLSRRSCGPSGGRGGRDACNPCS